MDSIQHKLKVLENIGRRLNEAGVTWAVGASVMLYFEGITQHFNDIDIMVADCDAVRAKEILLGMGTMNPPNPHVQYRTRHFYEFAVDGVDVDVIAGFVIVDEGQAYDCPLLAEQIAGYADVNGVRIPLHDVGLWSRYYALMHRDAKVEMIDRHRAKEK